ncbi:TetR family transcriptional regulator [Actinocorallia herbida]|uniref:TetR family transcriptional regulator n=1 Tax=Actinocorallia herbida TaxID=58109 RepID=A0A3N1D3D8_9ACTN|nr:TetR/AcrR family transcriptional regulator [Actinocorallia herbida]ROO88006.1 TetR family transcriptional regulator [Actinocorallia herbida]
MGATMLSLPPRERHPDEVVRRILLGALSAASVSGVERLSMRAVAAASGVSRGTVYRYFSSRAALLECMNENVRHRWEIVLRELLSSEPDPGRHVHWVMHSLSGTRLGLPESQALYARDPGYVLTYLNRHMHDFVSAIELALAPVLQTAGAVRSGDLTVRDTADLLIRIGISDFLVPNDDAGPFADRLDRRVEAFWSMVGGSTSLPDDRSVPRLRVLPPLP